MAGVGHGHFVGDFGLGELGDGTNGSHLHLFGDAGGADIERTAEDEGEAQHVVDLVHVVGTAGGDDGLRADFLTSSGMISGSGWPARRSSAWPPWS